MGRILGWLRNDERLLSVGDVAIVRMDSGRDVGFVVRKVLGFDSCGRAGY